MGTLLDHAGKRYGKLLMLYFVERRNSHTYWQALCKCGKTKEVSIGNVLHRNVRSCGCDVDKAKGKIKHGHSHSPTYRSWYSMIQRCRVHLRYVSRGLKVCKRWNNPKNGFQNFLADMGERPSGRTVDRIKNEKGYYPGNCRWATPAEQSRNQTTNVVLTYDNKTMIAADWAKLLGVCPKTLRMRISRGKPIEFVLREYKGCA